MSHFDDIEFLVWAGPGGAIGLVIVVVAIIWAVWADGVAADDCASHNERYVDSRTGYTLCEDDAGIVRRR